MKFPCTYRTAILMREFISETIDISYGKVLAAQGNHQQLRKWAEGCKTITVNGYEIKYNSFFGMFQVSHKDIGACIAESKDKDELIEYCTKG